MNSIITLRSVGGSLVATVPKSIVEMEDLKSGERVILNVVRMKKSFFGMAKGIGSLTKEDKNWLEGSDE